MKKNNLYILSVLCLILIVGVWSCKKNDWIEPGRGAGPTITVETQYLNIAERNEGDQIVIPVSVSSPNGIKRLSYYFVMQTKNGTISGTPVHIDKKDFPKDLQENISFKIVPDMVELVLVSFDKDNNASEVHIPMSEIRNRPIINFKDNIDSVGTVFINRPLVVEGTITSEHDLTSVTYKTVIHGVVSSELPISVSDSKELPFSISINVPNYLTDIIITAKNVYNGISIDTFKIGEVGNLALDGGKTTIDILYADSINNISGTIVAASDITNITYAIKSSGAYGSENNISFVRGEEIDFTANISGAKGMEVVRFTTTNEDGRRQSYEIPIVDVYTPLLTFKNIVLTSAIGDGNYNWFAPWKAPHRFTTAEAAPLAQHMSFALIKQGTGYRIVPPAIYDVAGYDVAVAPYMAGFNVATYSLVTGFRRNVTQEALDTIKYDRNLENFINYKMKAPTAAGGENYNVTGAYRRLTDNITTSIVNRGFVIGWGTQVGNAANHEAFGVVYLKQITISGGVCTVVMDITVPKEDMLTKYNPVSMRAYP